MYSHYFITGTSRGIGKAIAELLLKDKYNKVTGFSRNNSIEHSNYRHIFIDLSDVNAVKKIVFPDLKNGAGKKIVLINNSAVLGPVGRLGRQTDENIITNLTVNLTAPLMLSNKFIQKYRDNPGRNKIIVNISSGAGRQPIDAWSMYCISKAGMDMMSRVIEEEQKHGFKYPFRIYSIAPGIVETDMQEEIRKINPAEFSRVHEFIEWKKKGLLKSPAESAREIIALINSRKKDILVQL
ncbi:MAG: SDR family NAD(P)-dependent oxidoreductase [Bacteroidetes bacterium]|nr:SDR family NAD(P)-dependent oxidoreductase [Bacteroidota bacterium]